MRPIEATTHRRTSGRILGSFAAAASILSALVVELA